MNLFVDSSGWLALFGTADKYHREAQTAFTSLRGQALRWVTSDYVFDESLTFLRKHYGQTIAKKCGQTILELPYIKFIHVDEVVFQAAWEMFQAYEDKEWAFTDCTSFVLMQQRSLWTAFTFDHHFDQAGFQRWPAISLDN